MRGSLTKAMARITKRKGLWVGLAGICLAASVPAWSTDINIQPYGSVEMDAVYSSRNTNPLDPSQFNGYVTAAGADSRDSYTFNPRFSVIGLKASQSVEGNDLLGRVEMDFYGSNAGNPEPRLRLAYIDWARGNGKLTIGQDWVPVAALNPSSLDFSVMGYGGNLWQRIPQITYRQKFGDGFEALLTAMRFARGQTISYPNSGQTFQDPIRMPYVGSRVAYSGWGANKAGLIAISGAYRQFRTTDTVAGVAPDTVHSYLGAAELVVPIAGSLKFSSEVGFGQALGDEFFRFGQAMNGNKPVKTVVGFGELTANVTPKTSVAAGYGVDDPDNKQLDPSYTGYFRNERAYGNVVRTIVDSFKVGAEYTWVSTQYANNIKYNGSQVMLSFWYGFWL